MFELDFDICQKCCEKILFTDKTGLYVEGVQECCKTGYGYPGNPITSHFISSILTVTAPDGTVVTTAVGIDPGYLPPVSACASFTLSGTAGSVVLIADGESIGSAIYVTSLPQTIQDLVNSVNSGTATHGYIATFSGSTVTICDACNGADANGKTIEICVFMLGTDATEITLSGGANSEWCFEMILGDLDGSGIQNCFDDGVWTFKWDVTIDDDPQTPGNTVYTITKQFLFDCLSKKCLKELILLSTDCQKCNDNHIHEKIQQLRTDIEGAHILFEECAYDCANALLQKTQGFCNSVCLDC